MGYFLPNVCNVSVKDHLLNFSYKVQKRKEGPVSLVVVDWPANPSVSSSIPEAGLNALHGACVGDLFHPVL